MRIAILTSLLFHEVAEIHGKDRIVWGGAERYTYELTQLLSSMGHDVAVYQSLQQNVMRDGKAQRAKCGQLEKDFYGVPVMCLPETDGWGYSTNPKLNMLFNEISLFFDLSIFMVTFLAWPFVPKNSITISHGIFWDYPQHAVNDYTDEDRREFFKRQLYGFTAPDACVAVDSNVRRVIASMSPGSESRIYVIPNFVDTKKFVPTKKTWEGIRVLCPRRLTQLRGCNDLIVASQQYPEYQYLSVGQAGSEFLDRKAKAWGESMPNLRFVNMPMEEMHKVYQQSDIAVIPTRACEGLSLSLLESMSCCLPVVATTVGGLCEAVISGYNALVYEPNHGGLGKCIDVLAKDQGMRERMGRRNREIAVECFDIEIWRDQWRGLIKNFGG